MYRLLRRDPSLSLLTMCFSLSIASGWTHASDISIDCDSTYVELEGVQLNVEPTGNDDTANLQCALETAAANGISKVQLGKASYRISALEVAQFKGVLSGVSKATTSLTVEDNKIDCIAMESNGKIAAAIKFVEGSPRIQNMTIRGGEFCSSEPEQGSVLVHFSGGKTGTEECSNDVIFGVVDRVVMISSTSEWLVGILASSEEHYLGGCKHTLSGTMKVNRSEISGFTRGIQTSLRAGSQIDVSFNELSDNMSGLVFIDTNQSTYIVNNSFVVAASFEQLHDGIFIRSSSTAPKRSKFFISGNTFLQQVQGGEAVGIKLYQPEYGADIKPLIVSNTFEFEESMGGHAVGIAEVGFSGGLIMDNDFGGDAYSAIALGTYTSDRASSNWVISDNKGFGNVDSQLSDIFLSDQTSSIIVSSNQQALVRDSGSGNTQISSTGSILSGSNVYACLTSPDRDYSSSAETILFRNGAKVFNYSGWPWRTDSSWMLFRTLDSDWYVLEIPHDPWEEPSYSVSRLDMLVEPTSCIAPDVYEVIDIQSNATSNEYFFEGQGNYTSITGIESGCRIDIGAQVYMFKHSEYDRDVILDLQVGRTCEKTGL